MREIEINIVSDVQACSCFLRDKANPESRGILSERMTLPLVSPNQTSLKVGLSHAISFHPLNAAPPKRMWRRLLIAYHHLAQ